MMEIQIREAVPEDAAGIARVRIRTWQTAYVGILPDEKLKQLDQSLEKMTEVWRERMIDPEHGLVMFVAEKDGEVVGIAGGNQESSGDWPFDGELNLIYILKDFQQMGIGRKLVSAVAGDLLERGMRSMIVWVFKDSRYRTFYESLGGVRVGETEKEIWGEMYKLVGYGWKSMAVLKT